MLVECEAKRRLIATIERAHASSDAIDNIEISGYLRDDLLKLFALPYVDRPGYRPEFAP